MRVSHWIKNALVLLPILTSHRIAEAKTLRSGLYAFLAFSLVASAGYIVNDLLDSDADRRHVIKQNRAIASGRLTPAVAYVTASALLVCAFAVAATLPVLSRVLLAGYFMLAVAYTVILKRLVFLDVLALACFYTLRILVGGAATGIPISVWLFALSMFAFVALALVKRFTELQLLEPNPGSAVPGRSYVGTDIPQLASLASASAYISVLVLALYINSPEVRILYSRPQVLWAACPLLIYWFSRLLLLSRRGWVHDDPLLFALRDPASWVVLVLIAGVVVSAL